MALPITYYQLYSPVRNSEDNYFTKYPWHRHPCQPRLTVLQPGIQTTVQDWPGRQGYWEIGGPPSGPMDDLGSAPNDCR